MLQPMLGFCSVGTGLSASTASHAARRSCPVTGMPLCGRLSPLALGWVLAYSFTKRFTSWSHLVLGIIEPELHFSGLQAEG